MKTHLRICSASYIMLYGLFTGLSATSAHADDLPVTGVPIAQLSSIDNAVLTVMEAEDIQGCTVGLSKNGRIIYQRGFGWRDEDATEALPENATMRLASTSKAIVQQVINDLIDAGSLDGDRPVFDVGQAGGGILDIAPWPSLQDDRMGDITSRHLRGMRVYWESDYAWNSIDIYEAMGFDPEVSPPPLSIEDMTRYALGQEMVLEPGLLQEDWPDDFEPPYAGDDYAYTNFNYNVLVLVIEEITGMDFLAYLRQNVLTPEMWIPASDINVAHPFYPIGLREPHYFSGASRPNLYDAEWPLVPFPYGGFNVEAMIGSSFIMMSAGSLLTYMDRYPSRWIGNMSGSSAIVKDSEIDPSVDIVVICNDTSTDGIAAVKVAEAIESLIGLGLSWPSKQIDGQWVERVVSQAGSGVGSYDTPYNGISWARVYSPPGTKLQLHPGTYSFTGVLNKRLRLDAPLGTARIGTSAP